ncbi:MAG: hypothetical protein PHC68_09185 [Syntrophorhabdaceae bacterium]|nr:hypothetical protein [Syntrophorhabdaceae bacterium]
MNREELLEIALKNILDIIDSKEARAESVMVALHGMQCPKDVSLRNQQQIESAYALLGLKRPA